MKRLVLLPLLLILGLPLSGQTQAILTSNDFAGFDNSLELTFNETGIISFIKATYYPGPSIMKQYSLDVVQKPYELHDIGVVTDTAIVRLAATRYSVNSDSKVPLSVEIEEKAITLSIGREIFIITRPRVSFIVETGLENGEGKIDPARKTIYELAKEKKTGFLGFKQQRWFPGHETEGIDYVAKDCPEVFSLIGDKLEASTYDPNNKKTTYCYSYTIPLAKTHEVNLMNYLILLTQRRDENDPSYPVIHPVLLTLYYYDALMAKK
jgi:hypothetical protein